MKCQRVKERLLDYLDGEIPLEERTQIAAHLEGCEGCREEEAAFDHAEEALLGLAEAEGAPDLMADLHERLDSSRRGRPVLRWAALPLAAAAAAAVLLWARPQAGPIEPAGRNTPAAVKPQLEAAPPPAVALAPEKAVTPPSRRLRQTALRPAHERRAESRAIAARPPSVQIVPEESAALESPSDERENATPPDGVILLVGAPRKPAQFSSYAVEVSLPDGGKSIIERVIERDEAGQPKSVRIAYRQIAPPGAENNGG